MDQSSPIGRGGKGLATSFSGWESVTEGDCENGLVLARQAVLKWNPQRKLSLPQAKASDPSPLTFAHDHLWVQARWERQMQDYFGEAGHVASNPAALDLPHRKFAKRAGLQDDWLPYNELETQVDEGFGSIRMTFVQRKVSSLNL